MSKRRDEELPQIPMTSMIDIIFQLMIFFIVTMSVMPSTKSAPQVEGKKLVSTPVSGDQEVTMVIQMQPNREKGYDFFVLQGNENSAEFYQSIVGQKSIPITILRNRGKIHETYFNTQGLRDLIMELRDSDPRVMIRAPRSVPYGDVVSWHSYMLNAGITKIAWIDGTLFDLKAEIKKTR